MRRLGMLLAVLVWFMPCQSVRVEAASFNDLFNVLVAEGGANITTATAYGRHSRQRLDVYRAKSDAERAPVVLFFYGGGWTSGEKETYRFVGAAFATRGITTVVPDYRLFPEVQFPQFLDDAVAAYRWTSKAMVDACGRSRPIVVMGHSAGAYIAAMLALNRTRRNADGVTTPDPAALIGLAGPYAFDPTTWPSTRQIFTAAAVTPDAARPIAFARAGAPPALLMHGLDDSTVQLYNTRDLAAALKQRGSAANIIEYSGVGHVGLVLAMAKPLRWRAPVLEDTLAFIGRHGGGPPATAPCPVRSKTADPRPAG